MKVATVTTTRQPGEPILSFVDYHLQMGICHMFIFHEGERDPALERLALNDRVTLVACDGTLREEWRTLVSFPKVARFLDREVQARQILNAELGVYKARALGMNWLAHLDTDELLFPASGHLLEHFEAAERADASQLVFANHEAVPETQEVADYFKEVTLFKANGSTTRDRSRALPFVAYERGKAAARLDREPMPWGVHRFSCRTGTHKTLRSKLCSILHYACCGLSRYLAKYRMLGSFEDMYFEQAPIPKFYLEARDLISNGRTSEAAALYYERVMLSAYTGDDKQRLLDAGYLLRIGAPSRLLSST